MLVAIMKCATLLLFVQQQMQADTASLMRKPSDESNTKGIENDCQTVRRERIEIGGRKL